MRTAKPEIITFKVDKALLAAMDGIANRSEFIRAAVLYALDNTCPLCRGTGKLTANQKSHWSAFAADHELEECVQCHEPLLVCSHTPRKDAHARKPRRG
jgi:hypothetical protein